MTEEDTEPRTDREEEDLLVFASDHPNSLCAHDMASKFWAKQVGTGKIDQTEHIQLIPSAEWNQNQNRQCEDSMHISDKASLYPGDSGQQFNILESKFKTHLGH